jgi:hypothetical protein
MASNRHQLTGDRRRFGCIGIGLYIARCLAVAQSGETQPDTARAAAPACASARAPQSIRSRLELIVCSSFMPDSGSEMGAVRCH